MAKSKYEYVRELEQDDRLLKFTYIVIRIDGCGFHKFTDKHEYEKPNDDRGLNLMNKSALELMKDFSDLSLAYGQSDEYSFVFKRDTKLYDRRASKLISTLVSKFTSYFIFYWKDYFSNAELKYPPSFDGRAICYPNSKTLKDYLSWRQVDCHINNLYNTCFWKLVQSGETKQQAQLFLKDTVSSDKNELLFSKFDTNYNNLPEMYKKGSVVFKPKVGKLISPNPNSTTIKSKEQNDKDELKKLDEINQNDLPELPIKPKMIEEADQKGIQESSTKPKNLNETNSFDEKVQEPPTKLKKIILINPFVEETQEPLMKMKWGKLTIFHCDIINQKFWDAHPYLL